MNNALPWEMDEREKVLIGVNFSTKTRRPDGWVIERGDGSVVEGGTADKFGETAVKTAVKTADKTAVKTKRLSVEEVEKRIIRYARKQGGIVRQPDVSQVIGLSERQTREYLTRMSEKGVFEKSGSKKERIYTLMNK